MPLPNALARLNRAGLNRITRRFATWVPGLGVVVHMGRRSGSRYRTPVNVFSSGGEYTLALTYGAKTDWVRNVLAAGGCELVTRRRTVRLTNPRIVHDETRSRIRPLERAILRLLNVADFLVLDVEGPSPTTGKS
jgi:deazaflavin-dependent oxidoreductase (nitroreductase family)